MQKPYELMVLLHPDLEIDVEAPIAKVEGLVEAAGGRVTRRDNWGKKRLAYRVNRQDFAIYVYFELSLEPTKVSQLESAILITEEVLRHILVAHEENKPRRDDKKGESEKKSDEDKSEDKFEEDKKTAKKTGEKIEEEKTEVIRSCARPRAASKSLRLPWLPTVPGWMAAVSAKRRWSITRLLPGVSLVSSRLSIWLRGVKSWLLAGCRRKAGKRMALSGPGLRLWLAILTSSMVLVERRLVVVRRLRAATLRTNLMML
jgi:small subunit ribosomal protein S6